MSRTNTKGRRARMASAEDDDFNKLEDAADRIAGRVVDDDGNISDEGVTDEGVERRKKLEKDIGAYFEIHHDDAASQVPGTGTDKNASRSKKRAGAEDDDYNKFEDYLDDVAGREVDGDGNIVDENVTEEGVAVRRSIEEKTGIDVDHHIVEQNTKKRKHSQRNIVGAEDDDFNRYEDFVDDVTGRVIDADGNISDVDVTAEGIEKRRKIEEKSGFVDKVHPESITSTAEPPISESTVHGQGAEDDDFNKYEDAVDNVTGRVVDADGNISDERVTEEGVEKRRKIEEKAGFVDKVHPPVVADAAM